MNIVEKIEQENNISAEEMYAEQIEECVDLFIDVFTREPWNDAYNSRDEVVNFIQAMYNSPIFIGYVLKYNNKIIGLSIGFNKPWLKNGKLITEYFIDQFCIDSNYQGKGLGKYFMLEIQKRLKNNNIHVIILNTEENTPAFEFYKALNFTYVDNHVFLTSEF